ncbi:MAG: hypothetical protein RLZZ316_567 [Bacteroidota bacterium]|jgi:hypothetical protein
MSAITTTLVLWFRTLLINGLVNCIVFLLAEGIKGFMIAFVSTIASLFLTAPLIVPMLVLLKWFKKLPYEFIDRAVWLAFMFVAMAAAYILLAGFVLGGPDFFAEKEVPYFLFSAMVAAALVVPVCINRLKQFDLL